MKKSTGFRLFLSALCIAFTAAGAVACAEPAPIEPPVSLSVTAQESSATLSLDDGSDYTLLYDLTGEGEVTITCDRETGYTLNGAKATFTEEGVYTFTVKATNGSESSQTTITVTVTRDVKPSLSKYYTSYKVDISDGEPLFPVYNVSPTDAVITYDLKNQAGVAEANGGLEFSKVGNYSLTLTATYGKYSASFDFTVDAYNIIPLTGDGSAENPYLVTGVDDLLLIEEAIYWEEEDFSGLSFTQTADIDLAGIEDWEPIGTIGLPFGGIYDGAGKTVSNLTINSSESYRGFFGFVTGTVKNLTVRGSVTAIAEGIPYAHSFAAGIVGAINNGAQIVNCVNYANVTGDAFVGGIVGEIMETDYMLARRTLSRVTNCKNYGKITANTATALYESAMYFGGIAGRNNGVIENCENYGEVDGNSTLTAGAAYKDSYVGGITGYAYIPFKSGAGPNSDMDYRAIDHCTNFGYVHGTYGVGGIVGQFALTVYQCENQGKVEGENCVGGIAGIAGTTGTVSWGKTFLKDCINSGEVVCRLRNAGGIVGWTYIDVSGCTNSGTVGGEGGTYYIGGIAGTKSKGSVTDCSNSGAITATAETNAVVGGIVGENKEGAIADCTNSGTVSGTRIVGGIVGRCQGSASSVTGCVNTETAAVSGQSSLGGIAGTAENLNGNGIVTFSACENRAAVTGTGVTDYGFVAGIIGKLASYNKVTDCENSGTVTASGYVSDNGYGGTGGIVGSSYTLSVVESSDNAGAVTGDIYVGGVIGINGWDASRGKETYVDSCTNSGTVVCTLNTAGGIAGYTHNDIRGCENTGTVGGETKTSKAYYIGGIVGTKGAGTVSDCTNSGTVYGYVENGGNSVVGGIVGENKGGNVENCSNSGAISGTVSVGGIVGRCGVAASSILTCTNTAAATVTGQYNIGGIAGTADKISQTAIVVFGECKNYGIVTGTGETNYGHVGGIIGKLASYNKVTGCENYGAVTASGYSADFTSYGGVGGIAGRSYSDCKVESSINEGTVTGIIYVGGIIGINGWESSAGLTTAVDGCTNRGRVTCAADYNTVGGIAGASYNDIKNCENTGTVGAETTSTKAYFVGGIVGVKETGTVSGCTNSGTVYGYVESGNSVVGGIVGDNKGGNIGTCTNTGKIDGTKYVGGIVGRVSATEASVSGCTNSGAVSGTTVVGGIVGVYNTTTGSVSGCENLQEGTVSGTQYVGGVVGYTYNTVTDCENTGTVGGDEATYTGGIVGTCQKGIAYSVSLSKNFGTVKGLNNLGGIVGRMEGSSSTAYITVSECENRGAVSGPTDGNSGYIGGIVGMHGSCNKVTDCNNYASVAGKGYKSGSNYAGIGGISGGMFKSSVIENCTNEGNITGSITMGGIVGFCSGSAASTAFSVTGCTNKGTVTCTAASGDAWVGGIVGYGSYGTVSGNANYGAYVVASGVNYVNAICGKTANVTESDNNDYYVAEEA